MKAAVVTPWAAAIGILAACGVTLIGIAKGVGPEQIVFRALGSGVILYVVTRMVVQTLRLVERLS